MQPPSNGRFRPVMRRATGPILAILAIAAVGLRQLISSATVPAPWSDAEATVAVNAYAPLSFPDLSIPTSVSETITSWQISGYFYLTSASDRHELLVGATREFVIVAAVLTAVLTVGVCRRLRLGWLSTAMAVLLIGVPTAVALARIVSAPAALAAFWLAAAALSTVLAVELSTPRPGGSRNRMLAGIRGRSWPLIALTIAASAMATLTAGVSVLLLLGLVFGFVSTRRLDGQWNAASRGLAILSLLTALVGVSWVTVWAPSVQNSESLPVTALGAALGLGGLVIAAACWPIPWLRPLALGAVPVLLAAAWPGPAQAPALVMGVAVVAVLAAGLLDHLLQELPTSAGSLLAAATLIVAVTVGAFVLPAPAPVVSTTTASATAEVAAWIQTQLDPDAVVEVEPLNRAQLVRAGLDPNRLRIAGDTENESDFLLAPLDSEADLPLVARFGTGSEALGLQQVVPDAAAFAEAMGPEEAARSRFGTALASNVNLSLGAPATGSLVAGDVDPRLMICLAGASASSRFAIGQFTGTTGDLENGTILREVTLTDVTDLDPSVGASGPSVSALRWLGQFFEMQQAPFQPLTVIEDGSTLTVRYSAPTPLGLLP